MSPNNNNFYLKFSNDANYMLPNLPALFFKKIHVSALKKLAFIISALREKIYVSCVIKLCQSARSGYSDSNASLSRSL